MLKVQPVTDELFAGCAFALSDLVLVMRKHQIDSAYVKAEGFIEAFHRHRRAFDVPSRPPATDGCLPSGFFQVRWRLPQSEVARVFFFILVRIDELTGP